MIKKNKIIIIAAININKMIIQVTTHEKITIIMINNMTKSSLDHMINIRTMKKIKIRTENEIVIVKETKKENEIEKREKKKKIKKKKKNQKKSNRKNLMI